MNVTTKIQAVTRHLPGLTGAVCPFALFSVGACDSTPSVVQSSLTALNTAGAEACAQEAQETTCLEAFATCQSAAGADMAAC